MSVTSAQTHTLSHFKRHSTELIEQIKATGQPVILTVEGKTDLVVLNADAYKRLVELAEKAEMYDFLKRSLADVEAGRTLPAKEFLESLGRSQ